ncbi:hypothetical protein HY629_00510 [Candidatus Uhrbacteria bacterium]|nr:hypothetical protein [Candidatus Uhrbacteria bacterium]
MPRRPGEKIQTEPKQVKQKRSTPRKVPPPISAVAEEELSPIAPTPAPDRSTLLWGSVIVIGLVIVGIWVVVFRWSIARMKPALTASSLTDVKNEVQKNLGEFQKNFESITRLIEDRFSAAPTATGTIALSPDALRDLGERIEKTAEERGTSTGTVAANGSIDLDQRTWQQFRDEAHGLAFKHPTAFVLHASAVREARIAAFAQQRSDGTVPDMNAFVVDVHENPTRKTLKEFYTEPGRFNIYAAATRGTGTVYVDGIRAVLFSGVANVTPVTTVSVRRGTRVYEFSVLGAESTHEELLNKIIGTVRFE